MVTLGRLADNLGSDLRAALSGKDIPENIKARLLAMHEENVTAREQLKTVQEKLSKARNVCPIRYWLSEKSNRAITVYQRTRCFIQKGTSYAGRFEACGF